jgi:hypothetical protein
MNELIFLSCEIAGLKFSPFWFSLFFVIIKIERVVFAVGELDINILKSIIYCVMALKLKKTRWRTHCTH